MVNAFKGFFVFLNLLILLSLVGACGLSSTSGGGGTESPEAGPIGEYIEELDRGDDLGDDVIYFWKVPDEDENENCHPQDNGETVCDEDEE